MQRHACGGPLISGVSRLLKGPPMGSVQIRDKVPEGGYLAVDLRHVLDALGQRALELVMADRRALVPARIRGQSVGAVG